MEKIPRYLCIICYLKGNNKYKEGRINRQTNTKAGQLLFEQLETKLAKAIEFEQLSSIQIPQNRSLSIFSIISFSFKEYIVPNYLFN